MMKLQEGETTRIPRLAAALVLAGLFFAETAEVRGQTYRMDHCVIGCGGERSTSGGYVLEGTIGQPLVGRSDSATYAAGSGFWGSMTRIFSVTIKSISLVAQGVRITWQSVAAANYTIFFTDNLSGTWNGLPPLTGTGGLMEWLDDGIQTGSPPTAPGVLKRFYRIRGEP